MWGYPFKNCQLSILNYPLSSTCSPIVTSPASASSCS